MLAAKFVDGGDELELGEITAGAEDDDCAGDGVWHGGSLAFWGWDDKMGGGLRCLNFRKGRPFFSIRIFLSLMLFVPMGNPLLEYVKGRALRAHLAGLSMFAKSFCNETEKFPPSAASGEEYRAQALTSTVLHAASSDLAGRNYG